MHKQQYGWLCDTHSSPIPPQVRLRMPTNISSIRRPWPHMPKPSTRWNSWPLSSINLYIKISVHGSTQLTQWPSERTLYTGTRCSLPWCFQEIRVLRVYKFTLPAPEKTVIKGAQWRRSFTFGSAVFVSLYSVSLYLRGIQRADMEESVTNPTWVRQPFLIRPYLLQSPGIAQGIYLYLK